MIDEAQERERFEVWMPSNYYVGFDYDASTFGRNKNGYYLNDDIQEAWGVWLAAKRQAAEDAERWREVIKDTIYYIENGECNERGLRMIPTLEKLRELLPPPPAAAPSEGEAQDICGLCGEPGADKMAKWTGGGAYWPQEIKPDTELVHAACEDEECKRASDLIQGRERETFLRNI